MEKNLSVIAKRAVQTRIKRRLKSIRNRRNLLTLVEQFKAAKSDLFNSLDRPTIIAHEIRPTTKTSFVRAGDRNLLTNTIILHYIRKSGTPLDVQAKDISDQYFIEVTEQDLVDFIVEHPSGRTSFHKFQELFIVKESIEKIVRFTVTSKLIEDIEKMYLSKTIKTSDKDILHVPF